MTTQLQTLTTTVDRLCDPELSESTFIHQTVEKMATGCQALHHWVLSVDKNGPHVESDSEVERQQFQSIALADSDFEDCLDCAIEIQSAVHLPLNLPAEDAPLSMAQHWADDERDLYFVPLLSDNSRDIVVCLHCLSVSPELMQQRIERLTLLAKLGALRQVDSDARLAERKRIEQEQLAHRNNQTLKASLDLGSAVAATLEKEKAAFVLANELKGYLDVDRVTVIDQVGRQSHVLAVSGQVMFNRRANIVRHTQFLARKLLKSGQALWFDGDIESFPAPIKHAVRKYLDESLVQSFALIPIFESSQPVYRSDEEALIEMVNPGRTETKKLSGAILIESIQSPVTREEIEPRWETVQQQVTTHFNNTKTYSDLAMLPMMLALTKFLALFRGHTSRMAWGITTLIVAALMAGFLIQSDFRVRCEGYLHPEKMHHVFVRKDGYVVDVLVKEGQAVQAGDPLVQLKNRELEFDIANLSGELKEKREEHRHMVFRRLNYSQSQSDKSGDSDYDSLAEQTELAEQKIASLEKQLALKHQQRSDLAVRAPFDGQVIGWNVDRKFLNRPLEQGTRLFSVAKIDGQRVLELKVPDKRSGYVQSAFQDGKDNSVNRLPVEFSIASYPDKRFTAEVDHVNPGLELDDDLGYVLPVEATPTSGLPGDLRVGIPVVAKVVCGRRSVIYCKSYEFIDWVNQTTFEYLF